MKYIYIDNYRGFTDTLVPIKDVSFLVGENSTGKTSVLGLIKLLTASNFWMRNELDLREIGINNFSDAVSVGSDNKKNFCIGAVFDGISYSELDLKKNKIFDENSLDKASLTILFMIFSEKEGMPKLSYISCCRNDYEMRVKFVGQDIKFKYSKKILNISAERFVADEFSSWVESNKKDRSGYSVLKANMPFKNFPPILLITMLENEIIAKENNLEERSFNIPSFTGDITWLAPIRSKPRKTYDEFRLDFSPEGDHTPYLIKKKLDSHLESEKFKKFLSEIGGKSGLFKSIEIKNYGRGSTSPFELDVVLFKEPLSISSVGYGVSQALPVIVEIFSRPKNSWLAIQQPEVHLHPRAQAAFGEVIFKLTIEDGKKFIIETHSDYMIDRFRISNRKSEKKTDSQILFFERTNNGNKVTPILIDHNGDFSGEQPLAYREFFIKEEMDLLGL